MKDHSKILLILTGGTICSFGNAGGMHRDVDSAKAKVRLLQQFEESDCEFAEQEFEVVTILDTLSENMTVPKWNELIAFLKQKALSSYRGIIVAHGTDTLAYTAALLSLVLSGVERPVFLVSSQLPLDQAGANGSVNFRDSVELICHGIAAGVYVVYRNSDGKSYLHLGSHLESCRDYSDDFFSRDMVQLTEHLDMIACDEALGAKQIVPFKHGIGTELAGKKMLRGLRMPGDLQQPERLAGMEMVRSVEEGSGFSRTENQERDPASENRVQKNAPHHKVDLSAIGTLKSDVLWIQPYVGLDYRTVVLPEGTRAVLHGLYHSSTACVGVTATEQDAAYSVLTLLKRCRERNIPFVISPCPSEDAYVSGSILRQNGALPVYGMTSEMVYVKALVAGALGYEKQELYDFLCEDICGEFVRKNQTTIDTRRNLV